MPPNVPERLRTLQRRICLEAAYALSAYFRQDPKVLLQDTPLSDELIELLLERIQRAEQTVLRPEDARFFDDPERFTRFMAALNADEVMSQLELLEEPWLNIASEVASEHCDLVELITDPARRAGFLSYIEWLPQDVG